MLFRSRKKGLIKPHLSLQNEEIITSAELSRAACCNLGESFTTNPSVDINYPDALSGAKQIKLLGLSGTYVQLLTENVPNYRGLASMYSLNYIPGPWMHSIQVAKGISSVKHGFEALTGQINIEYKKPQAQESINLNLYTNSENKYEANLDFNQHLNKRLSTALFIHYENGKKMHDRNNDGFLDMPDSKQYNIQNRWAWMGDKYVFQGLVKFIKDDRTGGQTDHGHSSADNEDHAFCDEEIWYPDTTYRIKINTLRYETFIKQAYIFNKKKNTNIALILAGSWHKHNSLYGKRIYDADQKNLYANLMFESDKIGRAHV